MCVCHQGSIKIHFTCKYWVKQFFLITLNYFSRYFSVMNKTRLFIINIYLNGIILLITKSGSLLGFGTEKLYTFRIVSELPSAKFSIHKRLILSWYTDEQTENDFIYWKKVRMNISWSKLRAIFRLDEWLGLKVFTKISSKSVAPDTHSVKVWEPAHGWAWGRSRVNLLWNDCENDVFIAASYHHSQTLVSLDGCADVTSWHDPLPVNADYDITLLQTATRKQNRKQLKLS